MANNQPRREFSYRRIGIAVAGALLGSLVGVVVFFYLGVYAKSGEKPYRGTSESLGLVLGCMILGACVGAVVAHLDDRIRVKQ